MAFGLGFNKAKVLSAAEKYVQQGKLQNAIAEYEKVLKNDPKDLTVLNTVGDLYARLGQTDEACSCFKSVGDTYAQQGFTVKAIAMYKKLTKLRSTLESVLKLAELYTQQGLFNDARQQYLQVAEEFLRSGELEQAVRIFQKTLEMDPENVAMKVRLAEVYIRLKKKDEAWQIFSSAAEQLRSRGQLASAEDILQRMLTLDPKNSQALLMRGRNALEAGDSAAAIHYLQQVPDIDSQPDGLKAMLKAYLAAERLTEAGVLATKLVTVHNDVEGLSSFVDALMKGGLYQDALNIYHQYSDRLMSADQAKVLENLHTIIGHVRNEPEALEALLELFNKAGENTHVTEVTELLAHASVQKGELEKARGLYQQLATLEPQNPIHTQNLQQVSSRLGSAPRSDAITAEEGAVIVDELEATAPTIDQAYPENVATAVRAALTDAELFVSYNMPAKALGPLMSALPQAPDDIKLNQRLAALHTRAGRFAEAAMSCRTLEKVYSGAGYADEAGRYGDLARRYEERAGVATPEQSSQPVGEVSSAAAAPWPAAPAPFEIQPPSFDHVGEPEAVAHEPMAAPSNPTGQEIDLSEEWEDTVTEEPAAEVADAAPAETSAPAAGPADEDLVPETIDEIKFYIQHAMRLQALAAMAKLEAISKDEKLIETLRAEYETAFAPAPVATRATEPAPVQEIEEVTVEEEPAEEPPARASAAPSAASLDDFVADLDASLGDEFTIAAPAKAAPKAAPVPSPKTPEPKKPEFVPAAASANNGDVLGEFVADLEGSLGDDFLATPPPAVPQPAARRAPSAPAVAAAAPAPAFAQPVATVAARPVQPAPKAAPAVAAAPAAAQATDIAAGATDLISMFDELKGELEEETTTTAAEEDPETHYNLGVAFREMGLLDEAIGELQKVCHIVEKGHPFPQLMQTYTWLAQCFLDKGVPEAAIRWYEKALKIGTIDEDTRTALHYELASAYENANKRDEALRHFMEVYGTNIDYRDVAERIKALKS